MGEPAQALHRSAQIAGNQASPVIINLYRYREYIWRNSLSQLRQRYAGSGLGWVWFILFPVAQILVYSLVFSAIMRAKLPELQDLPMSFTLYLCSGLLPWIGFQEIVMTATASLLSNANYIKKLAIPEQVFFARDAVSGFITMSASMAILVVASMLLGLQPTASWWTLPFSLLLLAAFGFGLGLFFGVLNVFLRDIGQLVSILMQLWMWITPIVYVESIVPEELRHFLYINPTYYYIHAIHEALLFGRMPTMETWLLMISFAAFFPVAGYLLLRASRAELRDNI